MIVRSRVLQPDEIPNQELIVYRGNEIDDVKRAIHRLLSHGADSPFVLNGPPGTGKTMVTQHVLDRWYTDDVTAYVDCWHHYDDYHLLAEVVDNLSLDIVHQNSSPKSDFVEALSDDPDEHRLVVLDEADLIPEPAPLARLASAPKLAVLAIVNDPGEVRPMIDDVWGKPADRQFLEFGGYSVQALTEILDKRAEHGLRGSPISRTQLERISGWADGDARLGIMTLRETAKAASGDITDADLTTGYEHAQSLLHQQIIDRLTDHQRTVYDIVAEIGPAAPGKIQNKYRYRVDNPRSRKTVTKYLSKMCWYGLLEDHGSTRNRRYGLDTNTYVQPELTD